jgi:hypothetical protein
MKFLYFVNIHVLIFNHETQEKELTICQVPLGTIHQKTLLLALSLSHPEGVSPM